MKKHERICTISKLLSNIVLFYRISNKDASREKGKIEIDDKIYDWDDFGKSVLANGETFDAAVKGIEKLVKDVEKTIGD